MRNAVKLTESHRQGGERQIFVDGLTVLRLLIWGSQHAPWGLILLKPRCSCEPKHYSSRSEVRSDSKQTHIQAERDHIVSFQTWTQAFLCKTHCAWSGESERASSSTRDLQQPDSCSDSANAEPRSRGITLFLKRKRTLSEALNFWKLMQCEISISRWAWKKPKHWTHLQWVSLIIISKNTGAHTDEKWHCVPH